MVADPVPIIFDEIPYGLVPVPSLCATVLNSRYCIVSFPDPIMHIICMNNDPVPSLDLVPMAHADPTTQGP